MNRIKERKRRRRLVMRIWRKAALISSTLLIVISALGILGTFGLMETNPAITLTWGIMRTLSWTCLLVAGILLRDLIAEGGR